MATQQQIEQAEYLEEEAFCDDGLVAEGRPEYAAAAAHKRSLASELRAGTLNVSDDELEDLVFAS